MRQPVVHRGVIQEDPITGVIYVRCPRCGREAVGWLLKRADVCSPKDWGVCIREPETIEAKRRAAAGHRVEAE